ncbi:MAG: hypothetical protein JWO31_803, partial [Phycisphaerales bacterium]|nr:hypothetical protein [Phycisphaerales bacterium]
MSLVVECSSCRRQYALADQMAGKRVKCKQCGTVFTAEPAGGQVPSPAAEADDPFSAMAALESGGGGADAAVRNGLDPAGGGSMYAGGQMKTIQAAPGGADPFKLARPASDGRKYKKPIRPTTAVGLDPLTPLLVLAFLAAMVAMAVVAFRGLPTDVPPLADAYNRARLWAVYGSITVGFFVLIAPCCWMGVLFASKIMRFEMPAAAYARAAAVAALPVAATVAVRHVLPDDATVRLAIAAGLLPLTFFVLKFVNGLRVTETLVAYPLVFVLYFLALGTTSGGAGTLLGSSLMPDRRAAERAMAEYNVTKRLEAGRAEASRREEARAAAEESRSNASDGGPAFMSRGNSTGAGRSRASGGSADPSTPPLVVDQNAVRVLALRNRLEALAVHIWQGDASRESVQADLKTIQSDVDAAGPDLTARPDWADVPRLAADVRQKAGNLPSDAPDATLFNPMAGGDPFPPPPPGSVALG